MVIDFELDALPCYVETWHFHGKARSWRVWRNEDADRVTILLSLMV